MFRISRITGDARASSNVAERKEKKKATGESMYEDLEAD